MVLLGYRKDRTNPNLQTALTLPFILIMFSKMVIFPFPWYFSELELPSWNILKYWKISQKTREYVGNILKPFYVFYNISASKCEKWEIRYFKNTAKMLNKSNKVLEPTCGQLFFIQKTLLFRTIGKFVFLQNPGDYLSLHHLLQPKLSAKTNKNK